MELSPAFDPDTYEYTATASAVADLLTATPTDGATVSLYAGADKSIPLADGLCVWSQLARALAAADDMFFSWESTVPLKICVTAEGQDEPAVYTLNITAPAGYGRQVEQDGSSYWDTSAMPDELNAYTKDQLLAIAARMQIQGATASLTKAQLTELICKCDIFDRNECGYYQDEESGEWLFIMPVCSYGSAPPVRLPRIYLAAFNQSGYPDKEDVALVELPREPFAPHSEFYEAYVTQGSIEGGLGSYYNLDTDQMQYIGGLYADYFVPAS